ncbi:MAG TPA: PP2C family protein-serine/threonine phosphatase [Thermoanaerobaculia bacterium]|jgi:serine phosphatase RsbU (regulator of sigma subunit)
MNAGIHLRGNLLLGLVLGLLALVAGVVLADVFLPEWRAGRPLQKEAYRQRYRDVAERAGLTLDPGTPQLALITRTPYQLEPYRPLGKDGADWLLATRTAVSVAALHEVHKQRPAPGAILMGVFALNGQPEAAYWWTRDLGMLYSPTSFFGRPDPLIETLAPQLLAPGETLGPRQEEKISALPLVIYPLRDGRRQQRLFGLASTQNGMLERKPGALTPARAAADGDAMVGMITGALYRVPVFLALAGLFVVLALRSRISVVNAALLSLAAFLSLLPGLPLTGAWPNGLGVALARGIWIFLLWSCAESLLRSTAMDFTTSLDALRAGRLGPRGGRALLVGFAFGAALAGLRLGLLSLAALLPGAWPAQSSVLFPLFQPQGSPIADGVRVAGGVALALAIAMRLLPVRWAPAAAAIVAGVLLSPVPVEPRLTAGLLANTAFVGLLIWICRRHGLTALLAASLLSMLLPSALLAFRYLDWMPGSFTAAAAVTAAVPLLGWLGLSRSAAAEVQRLAPPAFVRRLEEERRFRNEMELLAKMQRGLLPRTLPRIEGYELAAHSAIANEAGGDLYDVLSDDEGFVWIAAGDVAGHGYSCAIAQAMTKAALASLIGRRRTPAEVLQRADRVLRAAGFTRNFTSLALLRLRPETGEGLLSNAGHPSPVLVSGGEATELESSSLPLGLGPPRRYADRALQIPPGAALVFCSDGLFEASDGAGRVYGYDRLRELLRGVGAQTADRMLETLLADWRRHLRAALPLDDTTFLVLRRREARS